MPTDDADGEKDSTDADRDATGSAIPAPFDAIPVIEEPTHEERLYARIKYPERAVPEEGAVPDPYHEVAVPAQVVVPEWALDAAAEWGRGKEKHEVSRQWAREVLLDRVSATEVFVTADGRDAATVVLERLLGDEADDVDLGQLEPTADDTATDTSAARSAGGRPAGREGGNTAALEAVATARGALESIDEDDVDGDTSARVLNALEQLDNILLDALGDQGRSGKK